MPRKALRCLVEVNIQEVSCPGVWLPRRDDLYVCVRMFGQIRYTQAMAPTFPLVYYEKFRFDKVFYTAYEPTQVAQQLEDEYVSVQLVQVSDFSERGQILAYFETSAKDFIYPHPGYSPTYDTSRRDVLMERSLEFPGICPKLEFTTRAVIKETKSPALETYHDMQLVKSWENDMAIRGRSPVRYTGRHSRSRTRSITPRRRARSKSQPRPVRLVRFPLSRYPAPYQRSVIRSLSRSRSASPRRRHRSPSASRRFKQAYRRPTIASISRCRSVSPVLDRQLSRLNLDSRDFPQLEDDERPPFVVRKVHENLIERSPGALTPREKAQRQRQRRRSASPRRTPRSGPWHYENHSNYRPWYTSNQSYGAHYNTMNGYNSYDDDDMSLTDLHNYRLRRSPSPTMYRSSLRDRYDETPWNVRTSDRITDRVVNAIRRNQSMDHLDHYASPSYYTDRYGYRDQYHDKLAPLGLEKGTAYGGRRYLYP